jgi:hypothetical protein
VRPAFFLVLLVLAAGCGSTAKHAAAPRAPEVTFKCEDMERGRVIGSAIVRRGPVRHARYTEPRYFVSRADAKGIARRLHARYTEDC